MEDEITLLTEEQTENLAILKKYGKKAEATDFYMIQGGYVDNRKGPYWTKTPDGDTKSFLLAIYDDVNINHDLAFESHGIRPVMPLSRIYKSEEKLNKVLESNIDIVEYGEYPQTVIDQYLEKNLERLYSMGKLKETGKNYTSILTMLKQKKIEYQEYSYHDNKYVRVGISYVFLDDHFANGREAKSEQTYWVKVEPIEWLIDKNAKIAIAKNVLTNMPFSCYNSNDYEKSDIKIFLNKNFIKEIEASVNIEKIDNLVDLMFETYVPKEKKAKQKVR